MQSGITILYGGPSSEREVSFGTKDYFSNLLKEYSPITVEWSTNGSFIVGNNSLTEDEFLNYTLKTNNRVIIASHGEYVEDGYIQEKFEKRGIRFSGSDSKSCRLTMDKKESQNKVSHLVKTIPTYEEFNKLEYPFIAKPNNLGSSVGIVVIRNKRGLKENFKLYEKHDYIFQPFINGTELSLGSVKCGNKFLKLTPTEIIPKGAFFDYKSKYVPGESTEITPARISKDLTDQLIETNNSIHDALGLGFYSRSDYILTDTGDLYYLETNALPGMTETSLVPQQLKYSGLVDIFRDGLLENLCGNVS